MSDQEAVINAADQAGIDIFNRVYLPELFGKCAELGVQIPDAEAADLLDIVSGLREVKASQGIPVTQLLPVPGEAEAPAEEAPSAVKMAALGMRELFSGGDSDVAAKAAAYAEQVDLSVLFPASA